MQTLDWVVLVGYFVVLAGIGYWSMLRIKKQEDFFMGGRSFGKILQSFAAFGAGTGSNDPVLLGRNVFTSGLSGIWTVLLWLFATPFYWIFAVWYRRMRHLTLGDWFVERYESRGMGAAYTLFALAFYMVYMAVGFTAVGKVCKPLIGFSEVQLLGYTVQIEHVLVPIIALVVILYGVMGGLRAAYWTDLIQGVFIILLSVMLIPAGLNLLAETKGGAEAAAGPMEGFRVMHEQVPAYNFEIVGGVRSSEFPIYYIAAIVTIALVGIVVQPHFIATGGGSAKTENSARVGLVVGNFMKRFCTVGWALTALIVLALLADSPEINADPDEAWGIASREILGPFNLGLVGLMLACLLAALMSSADCYMLVSSALVVRNLYAAYINPDASERECIAAGRISSVVIIAGGVTISLISMDVFALWKVTLELPILFAAPFWIGMFWRRGTNWAAWLTILFSLFVFFLVPILGPMVWPELKDKTEFHTTNEIVRTVIERKATPSDVAKRDAQIKNWEQSRANLRKELFNKEADAGGDGPTTIAAPTPAEEQQALQKIERKIGPRPEPLTAGETFQDKSLGQRGGKAIFWKGGLQKVGEDGQPLLDEDGQPVKFTADDFEQFGEPKVTERDGAKIIETRYGYKDDLKLQGAGDFKLDFLLYQWAGMDLAKSEDALLETLRLPPQVITPFLVMILFSLVTPRNKQRALDRYYAKMKTPVDPDPEIDAQNVDAAAGHPEQLEHRKLFPGSSFEFQKPTLVDIVGFVLSFIACFLIIWLAVWLAQLGS